MKILWALNKGKNFKKKCITVTKVLQWIKFVIMSEDRHVWKRLDCKYWGKNKKIEIKSCIFLGLNFSNHIELVWTYLYQKNLKKLSSTGTIYWLIIYGVSSISVNYFPEEVT